jgi:DNA repair photolyase
MLKLEKVSRRSRALTAGLPQCLQGGSVAAFNVISGCPFECHYCKYRARSKTPADKVVLYTRIADQLAEELADLARRKHLPRMVLFNTISDAFFGDRLAAHVAAESLSHLFARGIYVNLSTKGLVPRSLYEVLARHPGQVTVTLSVAATSESFQRLFEPRVALADERLAGLKELHAMGVPVRGRIEPLIPMENDSEKDVGDLLGRFRKAGAREVVMAYLQLDHATRKRTRERLGNVQQSMLIPWFQDPNGDTGMFIDRAYRKKKYLEFKAMGEALGVRVVVCACRNADIYSGRCFVLPAAVASPERSLF